MIAAYRLLLLIAIVLAPLLFTSPVFAREIYLDRACNLRDAIAAANLGATVGGCPTCCVTTVV